MSGETSWIQAQMAALIQQEKHAHARIEELRQEELPLWQRRLELASERGAEELGELAQAELARRQEELARLEEELVLVQHQKSELRVAWRRPDGQRVAQTEALAEEAQLSGLVDAPEERQSQRTWQSMDVDDELERLRERLKSERPD